MKSFDDVINEEYGGYELYDKYKGKAGDTLEQRMLLDIIWLFYNMSKFHHKTAFSIRIIEAHKNKWEINRYRLKINMVDISKQL